MARGLAMNKKRSPFRAKVGTADQRAARNRNFAIFRLKNALSLVQELKQVQGCDVTKAEEGLCDLLSDVKCWNEK